MAAQRANSDAGQVELALGGLEVWGPPRVQVRAKHQHWSGRLDCNLRLGSCFRAGKRGLWK